MAVKGYLSQNRPFSASRLVFKGVALCRKSLHGRNFLVMDTLRMNQQDTEEITRQMLLNSIDAWWVQYRSYRAAEAVSRDSWVNWRRDRLRSPEALVWDTPEALPGRS